MGLPRPHRRQSVPGPRRRQCPGDPFFLAKLDGRRPRPRFWIDEVGAYFRDQTGKVWGDDAQRAMTSFILGLSSLSPRIKRIYYYNLSNECSTARRCAVQDRGVVAPSPWDGTALGYDLAGRRRGTYTVIADRGPVIAPSARTRLRPRPTPGSAGARRRPCLRRPSRAASCARSLLPWRGDAGRP